MELTEATKKRLKIIDQVTQMGDSQFTDTELEWLRTAVLTQARGVGTASPHDLDLYCISAPVHDVRACLMPQWIAIRCVHGNVTWRVVRCRQCKGCRLSWRGRVRAIILEGCKNSRVWMWTLTIPEYPAEMEGERFDVAQERWHELLRDAGKRGIRFDYLRVVELQKRGTPHFHLAVKNVKRGQERLSDTKVVARMLRRLARRHGFGYKEGKTTDLQAARLGGAGVASYLSKYLGKADSFNELRREDGRAIRRYARSRGWCRSQPRPTWRYARCPGGLTRKAQSDAAVPCVCGEGLLLGRELQAARWVAANRREGRWVAPLGVADYLLERSVVKNN